MSQADFNIYNRMDDYDERKEIEDGDVLDDLESGEYGTDDEAYDLRRCER